MEKPKKKVVKKKKDEEKGEDEKKDEKKDEEKKDERAEAMKTCGWRMKTFIICFIIGVCCAVTGTCTLYIPGLGLGPFALLYSVGNICCLLSITSLIGPKNQLMTMCAKERAVATIILLICLVLTLVSAIQWNNSILALVFCVIQFLAFLWYTLSYVPYARAGVSKLCSAICC